MTAAEPLHSWEPGSLRICMHMHTTRQKQGRYAFLSINEATCTTRRFTVKCCVAVDNIMRAQPLTNNIHKLTCVCVKQHCQQLDDFRLYCQCHSAMWAWRDAASLELDIGLAGGFSHTKFMCHTTPIHVYITDRAAARVILQVQSLSQECSGPRFYTRDCDTIQRTNTHTWSTSPDW